VLDLMIWFDAAHDDVVLGTNDLPSVVRLLCCSGRCSYV